MLNSSLSTDHTHNSIYISLFHTRLHPSYPLTITMEPWLQEQANAAGGRPTPLDGRASYHHWTGIFSTFTISQTIFYYLYVFTLDLLADISPFDHNRWAAVYVPPPSRSVSRALRSSLGREIPVALSRRQLPRSSSVCCRTGWSFHRKYLPPTKLISRFSRYSQYPETDLGNPALDQTGRCP